MSSDSATRERQLSGDDIVFEVLRNSDLGQFSIRRVTLLPSIFHVYLHPADYDAVRPIIPALKTEIRSALVERVDDLNQRARPSKVVKFLGLESAGPKEYKILDPDWTIEFHPDVEDKLARAEIEVHSDLATAPRPEFDGAMTRHVTKRQSSGAFSDSTVRSSDNSAGFAGQIYGYLTWSSAGKEETFSITSDEVVIGRGGKTVWVDVKLDAPPDVSREHCRIRRDPATGRFYLKDLSQFGTALNGRPIPSSIDRTGGAERDTNKEVELPSGASMTLADVVTLHFRASSSG